MKKVAYAKFDESVEIHVNLGIDAKHADQLVRGTTILPHGTGKSSKVVVITQGPKEKDALDAGADEVGNVDIIEKIQGGWLDFDILVVSPDMMPKIGKLGKQLGTKGLMPSPKNGTVTVDIKKAVQEFKAGKVEYRNDKSGAIHMVVGKLSFSEQQLEENIVDIYNVLLKAKPPKVKGVYVKSFALASTMGPGISLDVSAIGRKEN